MKVCNKLFSHENEFYDNYTPNDFVFSCFLTLSNIMKERECSDYRIVPPLPPNMSAMCLTSPS